MPRGKSKTPKLPFGITEEWINEVSVMDATAKKSLIARIENDKQDAKTFLETNETIVATQDSLREITAGSREVIRASNNKQKHLVEELKKVGAF